MKNLLALLLISLGILQSQSSIAQDTPDGNTPEHSLLHPTIVKIDFPTEMSSHRSHPVSTEYEKYIETHDTNPVEVQRDKSNIGKVFIKGRGSLNTVRIYTENAVEGDYPVLQHTFRGVNYEAIDIVDLADGNYVIEYVSPHTVTEIPLSIKTIGTN